MSDNNKFIGYVKREYDIVPMVRIVRDVHCALCGGKVIDASIRIPSDEAGRKFRTKDRFVDPEPIGEYGGLPLYQLHFPRTCRANQTKQNPATRKTGQGRLERVKELLRGEWPPKEPI